jgi:hypothetical protein
LKTASSRRLVPVHAELAKLGFLDLDEGPRALRAAGASENVHDALREGDGTAVWPRALAEAVGKVEYRELDLSHLHLRKS